MSIGFEPKLFIVDKLSRISRSNSLLVCRTLGSATIHTITSSRSVHIAVKCVEGNGLVTVSVFNSRCETFISVRNLPLGSTQPGHPFVGRRNKYQPKGSDAWLLGVKVGMVHVWVAGRTV